MSGLVAIVAALAVYRLTMLVVADELTEPVRARIVGRYVHRVHDDVVRPYAADGPNRDGEFYAECRCGVSWAGPVWSDVIAERNQHHYEAQSEGIEMTEGPWWLTFLSCAWCSSWWIGLVVVWSAWCVGDRAWWMVPAGALAASAVTGVVATFAKPGE